MCRLMCVGYGLRTLEVRQSGPLLLIILHASSPLTENVSFPALACTTYLAARVAW